MNENNIHDLIFNAHQIVLDTGVLIEYLENLNQKLVTWMDEKIFTKKSKLKISAHEVNRAELFYILCREKGEGEARKIMREIENYITFHSEYEITEIAGKIKCKHSIALADCFSMATAIWLDSPIILKKERELTRSVINSLKKTFNTKLIVIG